MRGLSNIIVALMFTVGLFVAVMEYRAYKVEQASAPPPPAPEVTHGCAVFGGSLPPPCQSFPDWTSGNWQAPDGVTLFHVLAVGGGGGGAATTANGGGGSGGNSGWVAVQDLNIDDGEQIGVKIGQPGQGGQHERQAGDNGTNSQFGSIIAYGGLGAANHEELPPQAIAQEGASGGGGAGGGSAQPGFSGGSGGNGGSSGSAGGGGSSGGAPASPVAGQAGAPGYVFPNSPLTMTAIAPGQGGIGGASIGQDGTGCGGGGGGGGGGVLLGGAGASPAGSTGPSPPAGATACGNDIGLSGTGGAGYGAGGGGGGNFAAETPGGAGAPGVVYVEW